uniref:Uncharacterized protein n=1 Tax=Rhodnius prolixus TaxID=13249 RepID=T1I609_RHOPR
MTDSSACSNLNKTFIIQVLLLTAVALKSICILVNCMFPGVQAQYGNPYRSVPNNRYLPGQAPVTPAPSFRDVLRQYMSYPGNANAPPTFY